MWRRLLRDPRGDRALTRPHPTPRRQRPGRAGGPAATPVAWDLPHRWGPGHTGCRRTIRIPAAQKGAGYVAIQSFAVVASGAVTVCCVAVMGVGGAASSAAPAFAPAASARSAPDPQDAQPSASAKIGTVPVIISMAPICASCGSGAPTMKATSRSSTRRRLALHAISTCTWRHAITPNIKSTRGISNPAKPKRARGMATSTLVRVG